MDWRAWVEAQNSNTRSYNECLADDRARTEAAVLKCLKRHGYYLEVRSLRRFVRQQLFLPGHAANRRFREEIWPHVYQNISQDKSVWKAGGILVESVLKSSKLLNSCFHKIMHIEKRVNLNTNKNI